MACAIDLDLPQHRVDRGPSAPDRRLTDIHPWKDYVAAQRSHVARGDAALIASFTGTVYITGKPNEP
jgi:hypothetical protein